ncbi:RNA-directed DNA polymerase, eukaryota, reverse transcriptase zinc-binding domain protein [Tanacetum coccineum]
MRKHVSCNVRDGASIFLWHDQWWGPDHIGKLIDWNECKQKGLDPNTKIKDVIKDDKWKWPDIIQNNSVLKNIHVPKITKGVKDEFFWIKKDGKAVNYSTSITWKDWRNTSEKVVWHDLVWFSNCTPKHSFIMRMLIQNRLTTHERLLKWYPGKQMACLLCGSCPDSINHLFFECSYTCEIWGKLKDLTGYNSLPDKWVDILNLMNSKRHNKSIKSVMIRIILAACVYFIWTERNKRFFIDEKHNCKEMISIVVNHVRLKLASLNVKRTVQVEEINRKWKVIFNIRNEDGILMDTKDLQ